MLSLRKDLLAFCGCLCVSLQPSFSFLLDSSTRTAAIKSRTLPSLHNDLASPSTALLRYSKSALFASSSQSSTDPSLSIAFAKACAAFEEAHAEDPRKITITNKDDKTTTELPYSVHYHRRMAHWQQQLAPDAPEAVQLACRTQHIRRWTRPRSDYPAGLAAYKKWRVDLQKFHTAQASEILLQSGYDEDMCTRVGELLQKQKLASDPDVQILEDVICVTFLENEYTDFVEGDKYDDDKLVDIVQKTWKKMTPRGHEAALKLAGQLSERGLRVVERALEG